MSDEINETRCSLCKNAYTNPKLLQCFHVFCHECLHNTHDSRNNILRCETCNETFNMTNRDIDGLPKHLPYATITNVQKSLERITSDPGSILCTSCIHEEIGSGPSKADAYCNECQSFFCDFDKNLHQRHEPTHIITSLEQMAFKPIFSQLPTNPTIYCKKHEKLEIRFYCAKCDVACCEFCVTIDHQQHKVKKVEDSEEVMLNKIKNNFQAAKQMSDEVSVHLPGYTEELGHISRDREDTVNKMNRYFEDVQSKLEAKRKQWEIKISEFYDNQHQIINNLVEAMNTFQSKINHAENHFTSSLERFPPYYLFSLSNEINSRLKSIRNSIPKKHLKVQKIDFRIPLTELKDIENKIANFGHISRTTIPDFSKASEITVGSNFGKSDDVKVHCITQDENNLNVLVSEKINEGSTASHQIQVIDSSLRRVESISHSVSMHSPAQMTKMTSGNILVTDSINRNVVILNGNEGESNKLQAEEDNLSLFDPSSISIVKHGEEKNQVVVYNNTAGEINVLSEQLEIKKQIHVREVVEPRSRKSSWSSLSSAGSSRSSSRSGSRLSDVSSPDSGFSSGGSSPVCTGTYSTVSVDSAVKKIQKKPSQSLAINSNNQIIVAHEDEATYTTYDLSGTKLNDVDYKKYLQSRKIPLIRTNSNNNASSTNLSFRRTNSAKREYSPLLRSSSGRNSPKINKKTRTLITTDKLDNIYICRNKQILTFNAANSFLRKDELPEEIDPVSFLINPFGEAYVLSSNGQLHLFGIQYT